MYDLAKLRDELSEYAIQIAEGFRIRLDYSVKSIKRVEKILKKIHREYKRTGETEGLEGISMEYGAYIIKVIEENYEAGEWLRDHPEFGEGSFPYHWKNSTIFPCEWCKKRIFDGPADNVWSKFKVLVVDAKKQTL